MSTEALFRLDPYLFSVGFALVSSGLILTQMHRDEGKLLRPVSGFAFNLLRKIGALTLLISAVAGFWILGWVWMLVVVGMVALAGVIAAITGRSRFRLSIIYGLMPLGLILIFWA